LVEQLWVFHELAHGLIHLDLDFQLEDSPGELNQNFHAPGPGDAMHTCEDWFVPRPTHDLLQIHFAPTPDSGTRNHDN
jgi:hypothetical protein